MKNMIKNFLRNITDVEIMARLIILLVMALIIVTALTGCRASNTVSYNLSRDADEFKVRRRLVFISLRTNDFIFEMEGLCSIKVDADNDLNIICKVGEDKYQKHFVHLTTEVTYTVEQTDMTEENKYDYKIYFKPQSIVPIEIETEVG